MSKNVTKMVVWFIYSLSPGLVFTCESVAKSSSYEEIEWIQLMPKDDLDALLNPPEYLTEIEDGSEQDTLDSLDAKPFENEQDKRYQQALSSARVIESYNNKMIRVPGFIVPLESEEGKRISEFFVIALLWGVFAYAPTAINQIIYVKFEQGVELQSLYDAFWFERQNNNKYRRKRIRYIGLRLKLDREFYRTRNNMNKKYLLCSLVLASASVGVNACEFHSGVGLNQFHPFARQNFRRLCLSVFCKAYAKQAQVNVGDTSTANYGYSA
ncbi:DUF3299 domain-containing protein (plasmid) [Pseudoalteromonas espejiana]